MAKGAVGQLHGRVLIQVTAVTKQRENILMMPQEAICFFTFCIAVFCCSYSVVHVVEHTHTHVYTYRYSTLAAPSFKLDSVVLSPIGVCCPIKGHTCVCVFLCIQTFLMCVCMCVCVYVCINIDLYLCLYVCMYTHTHKHRGGITPN